MKYINLYEKNLTVKGNALSKIEFEDFKKKYANTLPEDYIEFMKKINGADGFVGDKGDYVKLWTLKELKNNNIFYIKKIKEKDFIFVGNNGGVELYVFDVKERAFFQIPEIGYEKDQKNLLGKTLEKMLSTVHYVFD